MDYGGAVSFNVKRKQVIACMHKLMWIYFLDEIPIDYRHQPTNSKNAMPEAMHKEFPNLARYWFRSKTLLSEMSHVLKSRQGLTREAADEVSIKPPRLSLED